VNRFGIATTDRPDGKLIWVHAASIGESTAALTYINHVKKQFPELNILITTITVTSADMLLPKIAKIPGCRYQFVVADNSIWIGKFLDYWQPCAALFLESEIWPNMIDLLHGRKIPIFLLNARLSQKSFGRWSRLKNFFAGTLKKFAVILAQSNIEASKFSFFSPENTKIMDNLKYANDLLPCNDDLLDAFKKACAGKKVFVAASTHEKEEEIILEAHKKLKLQFNLVTIIIPRHLTRAQRIREILQEQGVAFSFRSENNFSDNSEVFCIDAFGETGTFFRLADICFVGGSLVPIGGHNLFEPAALGKPVLHGPFMDNALEVRDFLKQKGIAFEVKNSDEIHRVCLELISAPEKMTEISSCAETIVKNESLKQIDESIPLREILHVEN
jgi:3-deoxy-D-manno-octulosonic-acid transferase